MSSREFQTRVWCPDEHFSWLIARVISTRDDGNIELQVEEVPQDDEIRAEVELRRVIDPKSLTNLGIAKNTTLPLHNNDVSKAPQTKNGHPSFIIADNRKQFN